MKIEEKLLNKIINRVQDLIGDSDIFDDDVIKQYINDINDTLHYEYPNIYTPEKWQTLLGEMVAYRCNGIDYQNSNIIMTDLNQLNKREAKFYYDNNK